MYALIQLQQVATLIESTCVVTIASDYAKYKHLYAQAYGNQ